jgi:transcriptional regulator with XRE-family HTH domain
MSVKNVEIAERIKAIRELSEVSVRTLAERIGLSESQYADYENGKADIPVSVLYAISAELDISMTELLTGETAKLKQYSLVRKGKGLAVERNKAYSYQNLAYEFVDRKVEPLLVTVDPSPKDAPFIMNTHQGHEFQYCLEGEFEMSVNNHVFTVREGDSVYFDSRYPHGMKAIGKPVKILVVVI